MVPVMTSGKAGRSRDQASRATQKGFSYLLLLFFVAIMGIVLATQGSIYSLSRKREKEQELLNAGRELRQAILSYYNSGPGNAKTFPPSLEVLLQDPRYPTVRRHLRHIPLDPMTNGYEWGEKTLPTGEIIGVFSTSEAVPLKTANFGMGENDFAGAANYRGWLFLATITLEAPPPTPPKN